MSISSKNDGGQDVVLSVAPGGEMHVDRDSLPVIPAGSALSEGEVYLDLQNRGHGPFRALPGQTAGTGNGFVAETGLDPRIWDLLVREDADSAVSPDQTAAETAQNTEDLAVKPSVEV